MTPITRDVVHVAVIHDTPDLRRRVLSTSAGTLTLIERLRRIRGGSAWCVCEAALSPREARA